MRQPTLAQRFCLTAIRGYQRWLAPLGPCQCRFIPSCSQYASEAIIKHGVVRGMHLLGWRLLRCQPLARSGYDPVPAEYA